MQPTAHSQCNKQYNAAIYLRCLTTLSPTSSPKPLSFWDEGAWFLPGGLVEAWVLPGGLVPFSPPHPISLFCDHVQKAAPLFQISEADKPVEMTKQEEERKKFEEKKTEEIPIKARGIVDLDDEVYI